ncbi:MAG: redox-regulated ATPase YchF [Candidatus Omnitrophica bacterium]|nr:redox-regulated ATPase YchF [Candidatus Omnitrophota bacterium]
MKIGIIGSPQSGKTVTFKILLQAKASGNIGISKTLDERVGKIKDAFSSKKATYPEFTFIDVGPTSDFSKKDLSKLQDIDLFICVIGAFFSKDPKKDFQKCLTDIIVSDLEMIQQRLDRLEKEGKRRDAEGEIKVLERCQACVSEGKPLSQLGLTKDEVRLLSGLRFLSLKPLVLAINTLEENTQEDSGIKTLEEYCHSVGIAFIRFFGKVESEVLELAPAERKKFLEEMGAGYGFREGASRLIIRELNLITFFTTGEKETRGWYLKSGLPVIEAADKIHSDMKRGFIRAEVVNYEDFIKCGSMAGAREQGALKVEGKDYIVRDGDILNIRFNV